MHHRVSDLILQTTLTAFKKSDFSSVREHEEFVWLHDRFVENEDYAGILVCTMNSHTNLNTVCACVCACVCAHAHVCVCVCVWHAHAVVVLSAPYLHICFVWCSTFQIPPPPPKPDFDEPRAKLTRLREGEETMSKEQYTKMKQELEA